MSPYIGYSSSLDVLLYQLPIFLIHAQSLKKELVLFVSPPPGIKLHILFSFLVRHML